MNRLRTLLFKESKHLLALAVSVLGILACFYPALPYLTTHYLGGIAGDGGIYVWLTEHALDSLTHNFATTYLFPHGQTLAWSDMFLVPAALRESLQLFSTPPILSYNLTLLTGAVLNSFLPYLLAKELKLPFLPAVFTGLSFALSDTLLSHAGHPQFYWSFFLPWSVLLIVRAENTPTNFARFITGFALGIVLSSALITAVYIFVFSLLVLFFWTLSKVRSITSLCKLCPVFIGALLPCLFTISVVSSYLAVKETFGPRRVYEAFYLSASPLGYFAALPEISWRAFSAGLGSPENWNFFGVILVAVLLLRLFVSQSKVVLLFTILFVLLCFLDSNDIAQAFARRNDRALLYGLRSVLCWAAFLYAVFLLIQSSWLSLQSALCLGVIFIVFSFGPLGIGNSTLPAYSPYAVFRHFLPGIEGIRASGRFSIVALLFFSLGGAYAIVKKSKSSQLFIVLAAIAFQVVSRLPLESPRPVPSILAKFATDELAPGALLILPVVQNPGSWGSYAQTNTAYMNWISNYRYPLVNGYSGVVGKLQKEFFDFAGNSDLDNQEKLASQIAGLRYVATLGTLRLQSGRFREASCDPSGCLYEMRDGQNNLIILPPLLSATIESSAAGLAELAADRAVALTSTVATSAAETKNLHRFELTNRLNQVSPRRIVSESQSSFLIGIHGEESPWLCTLPMFYCNN